MTTVLSTYRTQTQRILHDVSGTFATVSEYNDAINEGRLNTVADTGCLRTLQTIYLTAGQEAYKYGSITGYAVTSGGSGYTSAPIVSLSGGGGTGATAVASINSSGVVTGITPVTAGTGYLSAPTVTLSGGGGSGATAVCGALSLDTIDILNVGLIWGFTRYSLDWMVWSEFSAKARYWINYQQIPALFSVYGENTMYIAALPDQNYQCEIDSVLIPDDLVDDTSIETISRIYQRPIKYYAAYLLKLKEQSFGEAEMFKNHYKQSALEVLAQTFTRRVPSWYDAEGER